MKLAAELFLAAVLALSAGLKLRDFEAGAEAVAVYGLNGRHSRRLALGLLVAGELVIAGALAAGLAWSDWAATALFAAFALATSGALLAGRGGLPCACFGSSSRLSWASPARAVLLGALAGTTGAGVLPAAPNGYDRWLTVGLAAALVAVAGLATVGLALAREIGVLRLSLAGQGALEIDSEGPPLGEPQAWGDALPSHSHALVRLAVFSSDGCPLCRRLAPVVAYVQQDPVLSVRVFDEVGDAGVWAAARVPGSPYAVALDESDAVLAKGTFNNLAQLESIVATARRRKTGDAVAA